ncbi:GtrA family protein [Flaviaesturariibacter amylovorans]|uniref:GtrA family protein n=1 Tax=Flaviaesturariibacter amylovorans TaxID=1084520 RepID=A0ABP8HDB3_9BACT
MPGSHLLRLFKFGLVGLLGMVLDFGVTYLLKEKAGINRFVANACGFCVAVVFNFFANRAWTFASHAPNVEGQLFRFVCVSLIGLALNTGIVYYFNRRAVHFYLSKALAIVLVFFWNYTANSYFTFSA